MVRYGAAMAIPREAWGSTGGWMVAGALALATCGGVAYLGHARAMTEPTELGRDASRWSEIRQPTDPAVVLGDRRAPDDAAERYRAAAADFHSRPAARRPYDDLLDDGETAPARSGALPLLDALLEVRGAGPVALFADRPERLVEGEGVAGDLDALLVLGRAAARQGTLLATRARTGGSDADLDDAAAHFEAAYALGLHLYEERITHRELEVGYRLMGEGLSGLASVARLRDGDQSQRTTDLLAQREAFTEYVRDAIVPVWSAIGTTNDRSRAGDAADTHVGDVAVIATSEEAARVWRIEAILRLGRYAADADRPADSAGARRLLDQMAGSIADDPRLAAAHARALATADRR